MGVNTDRIAAYRRLHRLKQEDMAKELNISKQSYYLKETRKSDYTSEEVGMMAKKFGIEPGDLYKESSKPLC